VNADGKKSAHLDRLGAGMGLPPSGRRPRRADDRHGRNPVAAPGRTQGLLAIMDPDEDDGFVAAQDDD